MDGSGSGHRPYGIVSGKTYSSNHSYTSRSGSPDLPSVQGNVSRASQSGLGLKDAEAKRKKRIAKYKVYAVEGKVKATLRKGLRWMKNKCSQIVHGY